jgi:hypothetical protein
MNPQQKFGESVRSEGKRTGAFLFHLGERCNRDLVTESAAKRNLKNLHFSYKRYSYRIKNRDKQAFTNTRSEFKITCARPCHSVQTAALRLFVGLWMLDI